MSTAFCHAALPLWDDLVFHIDGNSKITASGGTFDAPKPNAFSLPHIATCPGSTPACRAACYVHGLQKNAAAVYAWYSHNAMALARLLPDGPRAVQAAQILGEWIAEHCAEFRWHVSGDVMSLEHAAWIALVCACSDSVKHWIYTRSFAFVEELQTADNLVVNLSADRDNYQAAIRCHLLTGARVCYLAQDPDPTRLPVLPADGDTVIFPDYPQRGRTLASPTEHPWWQGLTHEQQKQVCPADFLGQSESARCGVCRKCMV